MDDRAVGVRARLAGRRVLLTGVTGFVGEALLERLLSDVPEAKILVLVRALGGLSARDRIVRLLDKPAFAALRERLGPDLPRFVDEHVGVIEGDLARMPDLPPDLDTVIHCAGEVSFDPPIDAGFATNLGGVQELVRAIRAGGSRPHIVHISTAYVAGLRSGWIPEGRVEHSVDWRAEQAAAVRAREQAEDASRAPDVLRKFRAEADAEHVRAGAETVARDAERRRRHWVDARLVDAGRERARVLGWTDCYTFTKALGERYLEQEAAGLPRSIVRPSIIESALARPHPGWITGFKMAEPIILAYGRGELPDFPGSPDGVIDIIPVDLVVNAILAAAAHPPAPAAEPAYYHVCSGSRNPLLFRELYEHVRGYFQAHPLTKRDRGPIAVPVWRFPGGRAIDARLRRGERAVALAGRALSHLPPSERVRQRARDLDRTAGKLAFLRRYQELYSAYAQAELDLRRRRDPGAARLAQPRRPGALRRRPDLLRLALLPAGRALPGGDGGASRAVGAAAPAAAPRRPRPDPRRRRPRGLRHGRHARLVDRRRVLPVAAPGRAVRAGPAARAGGGRPRPARVVARPNAATGAGSSAPSTPATPGPIPRSWSGSSPTASATRCWPASAPRRCAGCASTARPATGRCC